MNTGRSLQSRPVSRQTAPAPVSRAVGHEAGTPVRPRPIRPQLVTAAAVDDTDAELRLDLRDLPRLSTSLHVDGFAPSLVSRLLDLFDRLRGR